MWKRDWSYQKKQPNFQFEGKKEQTKHYKTNAKVEKILEKSYFQNELFQKWAKQQAWDTFHHSHYDWWTFPIDQESSRGAEFKVTQVQIEILKNNQKFIKTLKRNSQLVCLAWGYKLKEGEHIPKQLCKLDQKWQNWPIRLYKMTRSLQIFQKQLYFSNAVKYGMFLIGKNLPMQYGKRNIKQYFLSMAKKQQLNKGCKVI